MRPACGRSARLFPRGFSLPLGLRDLGNCLFLVDLRFPKAPERMRGQAFFEKIAIDRLSGGSALPGRDDHLAIGRSHATGGIESRHARPHALVDLDLAVRIELRAKLLGQTSVKNVAAGGEQVIDLNAGASHKIERANFALSMVDVLNALPSNGNLVFGQPAGMALVPRGSFAVRGHDDAG